MESGGTFVSATGTGLACQISLHYSWMTRSEENLLARSVQD
jgi:hypothetical protein